MCFLNEERTPMLRLATPLRDLRCRTAEPRNRAYKLFYGAEHDLYVTPSGPKAGGREAPYACLYPSHKESSRDYINGIVNQVLS